MTMVILYVMDSLRPDFLSCYGYGKETSPNIDRVAQESAVFTHAFAQSTWTRPSGASILSSTYPSVHGVFGMQDVVPSYLPMVQETLRRAGFRTIAASSMGNISPHFGFGRGFDLFIELYKEKGVIEKRRKVIIKNPQWEPHFGTAENVVPIATSEDVNELILPLLTKHRDDPVFLFIWSLDTHMPYFHRDMGLSRFCHLDEMRLAEEIEAANSPGEMELFIRLYEDMIYYNDHFIGILTDGLKALGLYEDTLLILTGDHGEAFGEHGITSHGKMPHDEQIRVPLIMKFPFSRFSGKISSIVQHIDIVPTLLDYLEIRGGHRVLQGRSMMPALRDHNVKVNEYAFSELLHRQYMSYVALRTEDYKLMAARRPKVTFGKWLKENRRLWPSPWFVYKPLYLFDMKNDPPEKQNIIKNQKDIARRSHSLLKAILRDNVRKGGRLRKNGNDTAGSLQGNKAEVDKEVEGQLRALGYFD